jgi:cytochrome d ubiquinol oxidase subunit I
MEAVLTWSRLQFALTACFHWLFVPLTIGLLVMIAVMETLYVWRGQEHWKRTAKFWMNVFAINFAVGVASGLILEFEFGTNWSNYSWFVGDIFGAPLAIEGMLAFFMESVFIAVMFFGWDKVSKRFHLTATWLTALGATISALWILVANAWMQSPVGMVFNPDTVRHEMASFWEVLFSPVAMNKFLHTITSCYVLSAVVVIGVCAWFLLKKKEQDMAKRSMLIAAIFGLLGSALVIFTGDKSAQLVAQRQPMKLAAMEGLYDGGYGVGLVAVGVLRPDKKANDVQDPFIAKVQIPDFLSWLCFRDADAFVPGINNILQGGYEAKDKTGHTYITLPVAERIQRGKVAINALAEYTQAGAAGDTLAQRKARAILDNNFEHFGYGYFDKPEQAIPNVALTFYSFHIMVILGGFFVVLFFVVLWLLYKKKVERYRWLLYVFLWSVPLSYLASQSGWIAAEVGRQPWVIQDLMPSMAAISKLELHTVQLTFFIFLFMFTVLLAIELSIMFKQIKKMAK